MYSASSGNDHTDMTIDFSLWEIKGSWVSYEGSPRVRIYRNTQRKDGGYMVELSYDCRTVFRCPILRYFGNCRYFDLYGFVGLAYDTERDMLQLSEYGNYYRADD